MESTTLVTFMLHHSSACHVELLGSWDNFSEAWEMTRDSRRGWGNWAGCHKFRNIVCDGDANGVHEKRDGGLKMGGTYWYYYRIDRDEEYYDPSQPSTSCCPLLPGQHLNVLEVPREKRFVSRSRTSSVSLVTEFMTLNPDDKYMNPRPVPKPRLPKLMTKLDASQIRAWSAAPPMSSASIIGHRQVKSASSLPHNIFTSAIERLKSPVSSLSPASSRPTIVHADQMQPLLFGEYRSSSVGNTPVDPDFWTQTPTTGSSGDFNMLKIDMPKRRDPYHRTIQRLVDGEKVSDSVERISYAGGRGRAVTAGAPASRKVKQPYHRRAWSLEHNLKRKASSRNLRDPSPLRKDIGQLESPLPHLPVMDIPEEIKEVDESAASPGKPRAVSADASCFGTPSFKLLEVESFSPVSEKLDVNKDLPALPSYLIPEPLFASSSSPPEEARKDFDFISMPFRSNYTFESRFSAWTTASEDYAEGDSTTTDGADGSSPTLSSVRDDSVFSISGHTSPMISFSDPFSAKTSPRHGNDGNDVKYTGDDLGAARSSKVDADATWQLQGQVGAGGGDADEPTTYESRKPMTQMEQLLNEFEYLGAALM